VDGLMYKWIDKEKLESGNFITKQINNYSANYYVFNSTFNFTQDLVFHQNSFTPL